MSFVNTKCLIRYPLTCVTIGAVPIVKWLMPTFKDIYVTKQVYLLMLMFITLFGVVIHLNEKEALNMSYTEHVDRATARGKGGDMLRCYVWPICDMFRQLKCTPIEWFDR